MQSLQTLCSSINDIIDSLLSFKDFNLEDLELARRIEECKKLNSASFGTIGFLVAAVIAFTML